MFSSVKYSKSASQRGGHSINRGHTFKTLKTHGTVSVVSLNQIMIDPLLLFRCELTCRATLRQQESNRMAVAALRRKKINSMTAELSDEEREDHYSWRKHRLQAYKMGFFAFTFALQFTDGLSDIVTEGTYFFLSSGSGNGIISNTTSTAVESELKMGQVFDVCYGTHGIISMIISGFVLWRVVSVYIYLRKARIKRQQQRGEVSSDPSASGSRNNAVSKAVHRAAARLQQGGDVAQQDHDKQALRGGDGVSAPTPND